MLRKRRWITFERLLTENELEKLQQLETNIPLFLINILLIFIHLWNSYLQKKKKNPEWQSIATQERRCVKTTTTYSESRKQLSSKLPVSSPGTMGNKAKSSATGAVRRTND